ncbi:MAG TPA: DSD1 family PLP-dependent enzyme [Phycisphaerae bacterium]|nr:DSD1 family PLP-dependent enzyme [Phycisphaerae bacterium]
MAGLIGRPIEDLDTPALLLDWPAAQRNLRKMADFFRGRPAQLRPHFKNHKCSELARRQLKAGSAVGVTCAKLAEAEVLATAGVDDILIANQIVGPAKIDRLIALARRVPRLRVAVDDLEQTRLLARVAEASGLTVGVLIEIDIGMGRCGLPPGEPAVRMAAELATLKGIRLDGLQAYEGHLVAVADPQERQTRTQQAFEPALHTRQMLVDAGLPPGIISGGSTSTYAITGRIEGIDEIQAGTYVTMDNMYRKLTPEFEVALSVLSTVISRPRSDTNVLDVGLKGLGHEFGSPSPKEWLDGDCQSSLAEEHCIVRNGPDWRVGQKVELVPSHACTTCNLYRQLHVFEQGRIVDVWPIDASGCLT